MAKRKDLSISLSWMLLGAALATIASCIATAASSHVRGDDPLGAPSNRSTSSQRSDYSQPLPFAATQLWTRTLKLLNEHQGHVSKERLEAVLGAQVGEVEREGLATTYRIRKGVDWYLNARLTIYEKGFDVSHSPELARDVLAFFGPDFS